MRTRDLTAAALAGMLAAATATAAGPATQQGPRVFFLADPQVHNVHGPALKQMFPVADFVSKVAIRPAEVNLLAPLVLRDALEGDRGGQARRPELVVVLGDGTNIGCTGEADVFDAQFKRVPGLVRLMAHGNHDSYLMGTLNSYGPTKHTVRFPSRMVDPANRLPVDDGWFSEPDIPVVQSTQLWNRNWRDTCYSPAVGGAPVGTPMNKVRWLARYADSLAHLGLRQEPEGTTSDGGITFRGIGAAGTPLGALDYRARGIWYRPIVQAGRARGDYQRAWKSFSVQVADISDTHTLLLLDTSVCEVARGGLRMLATNAGSNACIGEAQLDVIQSMVDEVPSSRHLVFAAHFPLKALRQHERDALVAIMARRNPSGWTYVSGHTHDASSPYVLGGGVDLNIGSTTDWPMERHVVRFAPDAARVTGIESRLLGATHMPLAYRVEWDWAGRYSELCRHYGAARALADAVPAQYELEWNSPSVSRDECIPLQAEWRRSAEQLQAFQARISERFDSDPDYRRFVLRLAAGASLYEFRNGRRTNRTIR